MNRAIVGAFVVVVFTAGVGAQDKKMATEKMATETMDHMASEKTYSGCLQSSQTGSYTLTHSTIADAKKSMKKADAMAHDAMAPASLALTTGAPSLDLSKHVGHKVTVTGTDGDSMNGMATFKVKALKMVGGSCS